MIISLSTYLFHYYLIENQYIKVATYDVTLKESLIQINRRVLYRIGPLMVLKPCLRRSVYLLANLPII